jgi:hypothetical protein
MVNADNYNNRKIRLLGGEAQGKFKIPIEAIEVSSRFMWGQPPSAVRRAQLDVRTTKLRLQNFSAGRSIVRLLQLRGELTQQSDKCSRGHRQCPVAPVGQSQFAVQDRILNFNQLDPPRLYFIARE